MTHMWKKDCGSFGHGISWDERCSLATKFEVTPLAKKNYAGTIRNLPEPSGVGVPLNQIPGSPHALVPPAVILESTRCAKLTT